ncbi:MAG TPA: TetR/AcrR family transcriptional regulator [Nocardia sp.]|uniref:TetR/AcrR family transcriptional regulator n=1 Tax=Nocardia sp. TaxID=1821 RepID=UPI002B4B30AF|nr:TetR/AcrR family transcriptional regulator [Nocardia sp.]HLS79048.1 TetR/AcrR family transcriptional regulator [Nocardia sp.]
MPEARPEAPAEPGGSRTSAAVPSGASATSAAPTRPDAPAASSPIDTAIFDAARDCVAEFGVRRTTLTEVARRAGVSRPTVYRRWPDTGSLVAELLVRELREILAATAPDGGDARSRLVGSVVAGAATVRSNPLFTKIFRTDTDLMLTYVFGRLGRNQRALIDLFAEGIRAGQRDGSVRAGDPTRLAAMVLLIAQSAVQSAGMVESLLPPADLDAELWQALEGYLRPADRGRSADQGGPEGQGT